MSYTTDKARKSKEWKNFRLKMWLTKPHFCYLCGFPIPDNVDSSHPLYYNLDHIVPYKAHPEGLFEQENVMLTHAICNKKKGDRRLTAYLQEECQKSVEVIFKMKKNQEEDSSSPDVPLDDSDFFQ